MLEVIFLSLDCFDKIEEIDGIEIIKVDFLWF